MTTALQALVQAFVHYRLNYCNSLLAGVADVHLKCLQSVQNALCQALAVPTTSHQSLRVYTGRRSVSGLFLRRRYCYGRLGTS